MKEVIRVHNIVKSTAVLGPGKRAAIWFQGCERRCPGCMSPSSRPLNEGKQIPVAYIVSTFLKLDGIEGVTISGGEPFLQIEGLYALITALRERSELSVIVYTGYTLQQLRELNDPLVDALLSGGIDILIDGEYIESQNDGGSLRGSANQVAHFLTPRYRGYENLYGASSRNVEVLVSSREVFFIGIPEKETLSTWLHAADVLNDYRSTIFQGGEST